MDLLPDTARRLAHRCAERQRVGRLPSLVSAVARDGVVVFLDTRGAPAWDGGRAVGTLTGDTQFRIGSITKSFTAVAVLQLVVEGAVALADPLGAHLPEVPEALRGLRLGELLSHRSGLGREPAGPWWEAHPGGDGAALVRGLPPAATAGAGDPRFHYSNLAFGLLGQVVERRRGAPWAQVVRDRVTAPLGLDRTTAEPVAPHATGYTVHPWRDTLAVAPTPWTGAMAPAGALWSTAPDLLRWGDFLATGDPAVLPGAEVDRICRARLPTEDPPGDPEDSEPFYALGLAVLRRGEHAFVGHGGSMPGYLAGLVVDRPHRLAAVSFAGSYAGLHGVAHGADLLETVLAAEPPLPPPWRPGAPDPALDDLLGAWWWGYEPATLTTRSDRPGLLLLELRGGPDAFRPDGPDRWRGVDGAHLGETLRIDRDAGGAPVRLELTGYVLTRSPAPW